LDRSLGGPHIRSGHGGEEKNFQLLPRLEPPITQPAAQRYTIELMTEIVSYFSKHIFFSAPEVRKDEK
jgi:hypothetical protein